MASSERATDSGQSSGTHAIGLLSLAAIAINGIIGVGIFILPATVARLLGPASLVAYIVAAIVVVLVGLCFAEAGSQFTLTGGPYVYATAAFGSLVGFEVGWVFLV